MRAAVKYFCDREGQEDHRLDVPGFPISAETCMPAWWRINSDGDGHEAGGADLARADRHRFQRCAGENAGRQLHDLIGLGTIVKDTTLIVQTARKMGWDVDFVSVQFAGYSTAVAEAPGGPAEGFYSSVARSVAAYPDDPRPAVLRRWHQVQADLRVRHQLPGRDEGHLRGEFRCCGAGQGRPRSDARQLRRCDGEHEGLARTSSAHRR